MSATSSKPSIFPILLVNFIGTLGFSIVLPFMVVLVLEFGGNEVIFGIMGAAYSGFQLIGAPILGHWSDSVGRRKILILSQAGTFIAWLIFIIALSVPRLELLNIDSVWLDAFVLQLPLLLLFFARALDGITGGNVSVANAYLADITDESNRKENFGKMTASGNLGFILGPILAGFLGESEMGYLLPVIVAAFISLVAIWVIYSQLQDQRPVQLKQAADPSQNRKLFGQEQKECHDIAEPESLGFLQIIKLDHVAFMITSYFLIFLSFNFFYVAFPIHSIQVYKWSMMELGAFFSLLGGVMVLVQGPGMSMVSKYASDKILVIVGGIVMVLTFTLFQSHNIWVVFAAATTFAICNGLMWPSFLAILSKTAGDRYQGAIQGYASSAGSLASIIGLIFGGIIYGRIAEQTFLIAAVIMALIAIMFIFYPTHRTPEAQLLPTDPVT